MVGAGISRVIPCLGLPRSSPVVAAIKHSVVVRASAQGCDQRRYLLTAPSRVLTLAA